MTDLSTGSAEPDATAFDSARATAADIDLDVALGVARAALSVLLTASPEVVKAALDREADRLSLEGEGAKSGAAAALIRAMRDF